MTEPVDLEALRALAAEVWEDTSVCHHRTEILAAADEIERLRAEVGRMTEELTVARAYIPSHAIRTTTRSSPSGGAPISRPAPPVQQEEG